MSFLVSVCADMEENERTSGSPEEIRKSLPPLPPQGIKKKKKRGKVSHMMQGSILTSLLTIPKSDTRVH